MIWEAGIFDFLSFIGLDFRSYSMHAKTRDDERRSSDTAFLIWSMVYLCRFHLLHSHDGYGFLVPVRDAFEMPGNGLDSELRRDRME